MVAILFGRSYLFKHFCRYFNDHFCQTILNIFFYSEDYKKDYKKGHATLFCCLFCFLVDQIHLTIYEQFMTVPKPLYLSLNV